MTRTIQAAAARQPGEASGGFALPLLVLTLGHVLSNAVRTLPAIAADVLARDLGVTEKGLAGLVGVFPLAFALGMLPVGVALDRYGVRRVGLGLVATITAGALIAGVSTGPLTMLLAQVVLGVGCSGVLVAPMTLAGRLLGPVQLGLWSGIILAFGNCGMLLSASPLAWLVDRAGWRAGYGAAAALGLLALLLIALLVPGEPRRDVRHRSVLAEIGDTLAMIISVRLRALSCLAFGSFALQIGVRGLWGGPWLMQVKGATRLEAGNALLACTVALVLGPVLAGIADRRLGHRRWLAAGGHAVAAVAALLMVVGGPGIWALPLSWDWSMLFLLGIGMGASTLLFPLARAVVPAELTGRAMSAINMVNFFGTAVLQMLSGPVAAAGGVGAAIAFHAGVMLLGCAVFLLLKRPQETLLRNT